MPNEPPIDPKTYRLRQQAVRNQLIEAFLKSENEKIQVERNLQSRCVPKLYEIELLKDNECVDSVNKSDKDANTVHQLAVKEHSDSNGRNEAELSNSSGRGAVPNNLRSWGFERKKEDGLTGAKK